MEKITLDFTGKFKDYEGNNMFYYDVDQNKVDLEDINKVLGNHLGNLNVKDEAVRVDILAEKIFLEGIIEVEQHDSTFIKKLIHDLDVSVKLKRQMLKAFK